MTFVHDNEPFHDMEEVSFTYSKITWTFHNGNIEATDDWKEVDRANNRDARPTAVPPAFSGQVAVGAGADLARSTSPFQSSVASCSRW